MAATTVLALLACALLSISNASAYLINAPSLIKNVTALMGYIHLTRDMCDIQDYATKLNYAMANQTYELGKNARRANGQLRRPKAFATNKYTDEIWYQQYKKYYGNADGFYNKFFGHSIVGFAPYDISRQARVESIKMYTMGFLTLYMFHEVDAGYNGLLEGDTEHAFDEASHGLAVFWGMEYSKCNAPGFFQSGATWGCTLDAKTKVSKHLVNLMAAFKAMETAAIKNDKAGYRAAAAKLQSAVTLSYLQWVQRGANAAAKAKSIDGFRGSLASARAAFDIIAPLVKAKSAAAAKRLADATKVTTFTINKNVAIQVKAAITTYTTAAGVKYTDVFNCK